MAESSLSQRRQALPFAVFAELMDLILRPLETAPESGFCFGLRLVGIDGSEWALTNTDQINRAIKKGSNQWGKAAFAKLRCAALVEVVMHNALAARLGLNQESEWELAKGLLERLPEKSLLLGDRLYGCGAFVHQAWKVLEARQGHYLFRVKTALKIIRSLESLSDGSQLVEIAVMDPERPRQMMGTLVVREIRARIQRAGHRAIEVRLWTSLLDPERAPAQELVRVYMTRWEQELYFRELKRELGRTDVLASQTLETAAQELAAMIIGSSLVAGVRSTLQPGQELSERISFIKTWETLEPLWLTLLLGADLLTADQKEALVNRFHLWAAGRLKPKKRSRSCPRAVRRRIQKWPRKSHQKSISGPLLINIVSSPP